MLQSQLCVACQRTQEEVPLIALSFQNNTFYICPQHLPVLIHNPQMLAGKLLGSFFRKDFFSDKPFRRSNPTNPLFVIADERNFAKEKEQSLKLVKQFSEGGEEQCTKQPHSFFGTFAPKEWGLSTYKHLDHHLQQFSA